MAKQLSCINCGAPSDNETRLCSSCRESAPFPGEQLEAFLGIVKAFAPDEEEP